MRLLLCIQECKQPFSSFHECVPSYLFIFCVPFFLLHSLCFPFRLMPVALDEAPQSLDNRPQGGAACTCPFNHVSNVASKKEKRYTDADAHLSSHVALILSFVCLAPVLWFDFSRPIVSPWLSLWKDPKGARLCQLQVAPDPSTSAKLDKSGSAQQGPGCLCHT